ncbi:redoxin domain-containing protein [candidate division WOR-3 bacterium]|uniref:Redoxin domain-containing protein n=1 Tax=candidate division WOR-3 bacterium TaxID=2052148 RepID=A0A937XFQ9_UNCW3|nr:redoxin domain-containing protein [candidate division WOR-3 bacterium]
MKAKALLVVLLMVLLSAPSAALAVLNVGDQATEFNIPDTAWVNHQLTEFRGRVVMILFWQQW